MSFCRLSVDSDIYCYYHVGGYYEVWSGAGEHQFKTAQETIDFLREREKAGDKVPDYAFEQLEEETKTERGAKLMDKTFAAIEKLKEVELELHRLKNALEMMNKAYESKRAWQGLTDEEVTGVWDSIIKYAPSEVRLNDFARAIEAKLKEKNNANI